MPVNTVFFPNPPPSSGAFVAIQLKIKLFAGMMQLKADLNAMGDFNHECCRSSTIA